ncbi:hypothetical protein ACFL6O_05970 [candidate division KSB1 bacterium]
MGWNARLRSGIIIRQRDGMNFTETDLHNIKEMWLDSMDNIVINRNFCPGFIEFVQFETAYAKPTGCEKQGQFIGWTNGETEYIIGLTKERHSFHPDSKVK